MQVEPVESSQSHIVHAVVEFQLYLSGMGIGEVVILSVEDLFSVHVEHRPRNIQAKWPLILIILAMDGKPNIAVE